MNTTCCSGRSYLNSEQNILYLFEFGTKYPVPITRHT